MKLLLKLLFWIHNISYRAIGVVAIKASGGIHPKHAILKYYAFFTDRISENDTVLDIGCGNGALAYHMAETGAKVTGIDISEKNIRFAKARFSHPNITYIVGDATTYAFGSHFSVVTLSNVLEHIEDRKTFLSSLHRLTDRLLIRVPLITRDWLAVYKKDCGAEYRLDNTHYIEYTEESFQKELSEAGFKVDHSSVKFGELFAEISKSSP